MRKLLLIPVFLTALVVACGDGGPADLTDREISDEELSLMVLPQSALGQQYADFELNEEESGFESNEDAIEGAFDEEDEAEDVERFGRLNGYDKAYSSPTALLEGEGVLHINTGVDLYQDAEGASGDLQDVVEDAHRAVGKTSDNVTLEDVQEFDPGDVGDEAAGLVLILSASGSQETALYLTSVGFRRGRLIGSANILRLDDEDVRDEAAALARQLDQRILAVLRGEVEVTPTLTPEPTPMPQPTSALTPGPTSAPVAGVSPSDVLDSFRFASETSVEVSGGLTLTAEGEFQAPDRLACTVSGSMGGLTKTEKVVVIGEEAWIDTGDGFQATSADDPEVVGDLDLCPGSPVFWEDFDLLKDMGPLSGQPDTVNGIATTRYALGEAAEALRSIGFLPSEMEGVTINALDVWVAEDEGWPVAIDFDVSSEAQTFAEAFGISFEGEAQQARMTMQVEIIDVNDADIRVEPPIS